MCKRAFLLLLALMLVPSFAGATVYWQINTTTSPTTYNSNLTAAAPANVGDYTISVNLTKVTNAAVSAVNFNVAAVAGTSVVVRVDGAQVGAAPGTYTVTKGSLLNHNIVAYYSLSTSTITTQPAAGGSITPSFSYTTNGVVTITPFAGYQVSGLLYSTAKITAANPGTLIPLAIMTPGANGAYSHTISSGSYFLQAVFTPAPVAKAVISTPNLTVQNGASIAIDGSTSSSNVAGTLYGWSASCGTVMATAPNAKSATYTAPAVANSCTVTLTVTAAGVAPNPTAAVRIDNYKYDPSLVCLDCHDGTNGPSSDAYLRSSHRTNTFHPVSCQNCHNPNNDLSHAYAQSFNVCATCHKPGGTYGIYGSDLVAKAPHGGGVATPATGAVKEGDGITQYLTQGAICSDCHGHDNTINAGFAEGGHGKVSSDALNAFVHYDWNLRTNNGTRQNGNCDRCHTAVGFIKLLGQDTVMQTRLALVSGQPNNVLICVGCHSSVDTGALRIDATPPGNPTPLTGGYFALFSSSAADITAGNTKIQVQFPGFKNSSICVPCHSGRSTDKVFIETIAKSLAVSQNDSTISTKFYQHAANMAQTFIGKGGFDFTGNLANVLANGHTNVQMGTTEDQGPCVGCHYSTLTKTNINNATHSLEVDAANGVCRSCHMSDFGPANVAAAKANYDAAVAVLDALIRAKLNPLRVNQTLPLETERAQVRFGQFGKTAGSAADATTATKAYGAWYNWQILTVYDQGAYAHNPAYARQLLNDTGDYLLNPTGAYGGQTFNAYIKTLPGGISEITAANALAATKNVGCSGCHTSTVDPYAGNNIIATYNASGHSNNAHGPTCATCHAPSSTVIHPTGANPETSMLDGYIAAGQACINCHNGNYSQSFGPIQHFSNVSSATTPKISITAAYVGYKGKGINVCATCHFKFDPHGIGATTVATFQNNGPVLTAWAESGHGKQSGPAWVPSSSHDWRNTGSAVDFSTNIPKEDCVRCHTAAGFSQFATSGFKNVNKVGASDGLQKFNSPLDCSGCHVKDASGSVTAARVATAGVTTFYNISTVDKVTNLTVKARTAVNFPNVGDSNLCNSCHSARLGGVTLVQAVTNGLSLSNSGFQNSHYMGAAGLMYMKAGFTDFIDPRTAIYDGKGVLTTYGKTLTADNASTPDGIVGGVTSTHRKLGTPAMISDSHVGGRGFIADGPCVTCHMQATAATARDTGKGHSLLIGEDTTGAAYKQVCILCHTSEGSFTGPVAIAADGSNFAAAFLEPNKEAFTDSVKLALYYLLKNYNISYNPASYPYFYDEAKGLDNSKIPPAPFAVTDWTRGGTLTPAEALKLEGACLNINLVSRDPASYVHARTYVRRLVYDSIDFLDNRLIDLSVGTSAQTATTVTGSTTGTVVDVTGKFTKAATAYTDSTLGTITAGNTEGMLYINAWVRTSGAWNAAPNTERP